jgi:molybdopterin synthase sulfur carrier subunit
MAQVKLFGHLRDYVVAPQITVEGDTVSDVLARLCSENAALEQAVFDAGNLRAHVRVMVNGHAIEMAQGLDTPLTPADRLAVFPPIAGGSST